MVYIQRLVSVAGSLLLLAAPPAAAQVFLPDDPIWEDADRLNMPPPAEREIPDLYDFVLHTFSDPEGVIGPAANVNTLGEVPNSSWYTNRHYARPMTLDELVRGPDSVEGPSLEGPWQVVDAKTQGVSLGMQIVDGRGDRYLLKFDAKGYPEMSTGAEVVVTKLFYALGYNVPENYPVRFRREDLVVGEDAEYENEEGEEVPLTEEFITEVLGRAYRYEDGGYRALASKFLSGKPIGPFKYHDTRPDDANDIFPHQLRRELRGMRVFGAWINHFDARAANTLDMIIEEDGRTYVRHHLIDFGSTLGGGPLGPRARWIGHEYAIQFWPIVARALTLGFGGSRWVDLDYPENATLGLFEWEGFDPRAWRPQYPNPAFQQMDADDAFWAARQVMAFSDEALRALAATARYSDPEAERLLARALTERRNAIGRAFLPHGGGLDRFTVEGRTLRFDDLLARHALPGAGAARTVAWRAFDNQTGARGEVLLQADATADAVALPTRDEPFLVGEIATSGLGTTEVFLRRKAGTYEVVGIRRNTPRAIAERGSRIAD